MAQYIPKATVAAEIKRRIKEIPKNETDKRLKAVYGNEAFVLMELLSFLDTIKVKEADTWHLQEKEDIYDAVKDWGLYTFACVMKDGTIQKFTGHLDEDSEGHVNVHIDGANDDYDNVDDIVKWIEIV